jgi:hypothetical protein
LLLKLGGTHNGCGRGFEEGTKIQILMASKIHTEVLWNCMPVIGHMKRKFQIFYQNRYRNNLLLIYEDV